MASVSYFCHYCDQPITSVEETTDGLKCTQCGNEYVEIVDDDNDTESYMRDSAPQSESQSPHQQQSSSNNNNNSFNNNNPNIGAFPNPFAQMFGAQQQPQSMAPFQNLFQMFGQQPMMQSQSQSQSQPQSQSQSQSHSHSQSNNNHSFQSSSFQFGGGNGQFFGMVNGVPFGNMNNNNNNNNGNNSFMASASSSSSTTSSSAPQQPFGANVNANANANGAMNPPFFNLFQSIFGGGGNRNGNFGDYGFGNMTDIIEQLERMHPNRSGPPPAAQQSLDSLKTEIYNPVTTTTTTTTDTDDDSNDVSMIDGDDENDRKEGETQNNSSLSTQCAVCKDEYIKGDELHSLPCAHRYHKECILPWLKAHNTCPVCRYEFPTDDPFYEQMREARRQQEQRSNQQQSRPPQ